MLTVEPKQLNRKKEKSPLFCVKKKKKKFSNRATHERVHMLEKDIDQPLRMHIAKKKETYGIKLPFNDMEYFFRIVFITHLYAFTHLLNNVFEILN